MKTQCPACRRIYNAAPDYVNKRTRCKSCGVDFVMLEYVQPEETSVKEDERTAGAASPPPLGLNAANPQALIIPHSG